MATDPQANTGREHAVGNLTSPLLAFDINQEIEKLRQEGRWQSGHTAKTLVKYADLRVVLVAMNAGGRLAEHRTEGRISVQALSGQILFRAGGQAIEMSVGHLLTLERGISHDVEGVTDSAFLLTIAWPEK